MIFSKGQGNMTPTRQKQAMKRKKNNNKNKLVQEIKGK